MIITTMVNNILAESVRVNLLYIVMLKHTDTHEKKKL